MPIGNPLLFKYAIFFQFFSLHSCLLVYAISHETRRKSIRATGICQGADFGRSKGKDK